MNVVKLLQLPADFNTWQIFENHPFRDNGGDPDGPAWLQDVRYFLRREIADALAIGAKIIVGYEVRYVPTDPPPHFGDNWCGYGYNRVAYTTDLFTATVIARHAAAQEAAGR